MRDANLASAPVPLPGPRVATNEVAIHPDDNTVLARVSSGAAAGQDLWWWTLTDTTPHPFTSALEFETGARFSPDGKYVAYNAAVAGASDVYVAPFPGPGGRVRVARAGVGLPVWGQDARTLYFPQDNTLVEATLSYAPTIFVRSTRVVVDGNFAMIDPLHAAFDAAPDGTIVLVRSVREPRLIIIPDFAAEIRKRLGRQGVR